MAYFTVKEDYIYDPTPCFDYLVSGRTEIKLGRYYTENNFQAQVYYREQADNSSVADYRISHFSQSAKALAYQLAQDFFIITSDLQIKLNSKGYVGEICNLDSVFQKYQQHKSSLLEKYKNVPDFETILSNYEKNIQDEEKLRNSIFYKGINRIFFTALKPVIRHTLGNQEVTRIRNYPDPIFSVSFPIRETILWKKEGGNYRVEIKGNIDFERMEQEKMKERFLQACSVLVDNKVEASDVIFQSRENYTLDPKLNYERADTHYIFDIKGIHVKKDNLRYYLKSKSYV